ANMTDIVEIQLNRLRKLLVDRKVTLKFDSKALQWLANRGYDPVYGARPLKRGIQRSLQNPLATLLLEGKVKEGDTVEVSVSGGELTVAGERVLSEAADCWPNPSHWSPSERRLLTLSRSSLKRESAR